MQKKKKKVGLKQVQKRWSQILFIEKKKNRYQTLKNVTVNKEIELEASARTLGSRSNFIIRYMQDVIRLYTHCTFACIPGNTRNRLLI